MDCSLQETAYYLKKKKKKGKVESDVTIINQILSVWANSQGLQQWWSHFVWYILNKF